MIEWCLWGYLWFLANTHINAKLSTMGFLKAVEGVADLHWLEPFWGLIGGSKFAFSPPNELLAQLPLQLLLRLHHLLRQFHLGKKFWTKKCRPPKLKLQQIIYLFSKILQAIYIKVNQMQQDNPWLGCGPKNGLWALIKETFCQGRLIYGTMTLLHTQLRDCFRRTALSKMGLTDMLILSPNSHTGFVYMTTTT